MLSFPVGTVVGFAEAHNRELVPANEDGGWWLVTGALASEGGLVYTINGDTDYEFSHEDLEFISEVTEDTLEIANALTEAGASGFDLEEEDEDPEPQEGDEEDDEE